MCYFTKAKSLKENEHPDHENETNNAQDAEKSYPKLFKPRLLDASKWHPDNTIQTISNHCADIMHVPNNNNKSPTNKFISSDMRKAHCELILQELESSNESFDHTKLNSKDKSVKIGIKSLIEIFKDSVFPNQRDESMSMIKNEQLIFKSFAPTCLNDSCWKELSNPVIGAQTNLEY